MNTARRLRAAWGPRTRGLLLETPSNPAGTVIARKELERIARFIAQRGGVLMVDEIYQGLVYGALPSTALGLRGEVVVINSFSKYFCMTGWRLGWVVLPRQRISQFEKLAQHLFICAPAISQHAALACFSAATLKVLERRRAEFQRRRDFLVPALERASLAVPARPSGAFYVYADCGLAGRHQVPLSGKRFAYTRSMADLEEAARRLKKFCSGMVRPKRRAGTASGSAPGASARRAP